MSAASKKRKLDDETTKYYAVKSGHKPGVYLSWHDCQENITHFKGAQFKSFTSLQDANNFVAGRPTAAGSASAKSQIAKFYGVAVGRVPGVYEDWDEASEQIRAVKGPKYKKFATRREAEEFVRTGGKSSTKAEATSTSAGDIPNAKKVKISQSSSSKGSSKGGSKSSSKAKVLRVYTDGSSLGNGKFGAAAGVGVFFGVGDKRNVSEPLQGEVQTNQRAELTAVLRALEVAPKEQDMQIVTDSTYSINCCTAWYKNWEINGWKTSVGGPVLNKDLVMSIRALVDQRLTKDVKTDFVWIKGHSNDPGNEAADRLAVGGAAVRRS